MTRQTGFYLQKIKGDPFHNNVLYMLLSFAMYFQVNAYKRLKEKYTLKKKDKRGIIIYPLMFCMADTTL